ncbi:AAA family ATPase [Glutamicibacter uratoxydans]|uniref:AAA family ATPase n=1 Tax=Glutamicibacter uratoxydans TaxID=43667 RepID=UPI002482DF48
MEVKGRCYVEAEKIEFFPIPEKKQRQQPRVAVVYGKNGTGKSTIGESLAMLCYEQAPKSLNPTESPADPIDLDVMPLFQANNQSSVSEETDSLVFNESFIERHVKLKREGLETVVLFGDQVQVQERLERAQTARKLQNSVVEDATTEHDEAIQAELHAFNALQKSLRLGWAQRQKKIRGNSGASPVGKEIVTRIAKTSFRSDRPANFTSELSNRIDEFLDTVDSEVPQRPWVGLLDKNFAQTIDGKLLETTLEAPTGSGIAAKVGKALQDFASDVHRARNLFADDAVSCCPLCLQDTSANYKQQLVAAISSAIDDEAMAFSNKLDRSKVPLVTLDTSLIDSRFSVEAARFDTARVTLNQQLEKWNEACESKKLAMYSVVHWNNECLQAATQDLMESILSLESRANEIDLAIQERAKRQKQLEDENVIAARIECDSLVKTFIEAKVRLSKAEAAFELEDKKLVDAAELEANLSAQLMNAQVAVDDINSSLRAIFAEDERLALTLSISPEADPHYVLRARGRAVRPDRLSIGERNIVALAYFFISVRKRLDELLRTASNRWLIIGVDDPVSSMDMDNRLGIHGFLSSQMQRIFTSGHERVRMVLLTHDLGVARELDKASVTSLLNAVKARGENWNWGFNQVKSQLISRFELNMSHGLVRIDGKLDAQNDYGKLINIMWRSATDKLSVDDVLSLTIANVTRRVLEAFSTFIYNESSIPSQTLSDEYARATSGAELIVDLGPGHRMFLHGNSHSEDQITAMSDYGGITGVDTDEQIRHVRKVLAVMFTLQPYHVTSYLEEGSNITIPTLESWCSDLLGQKGAERV